MNYYGPRWKRQTAGGGGTVPGLAAVFDGAYEDSVTDPTNASAGFTYASTGGVSGWPTGPSGTWLLSGLASAYEIKVSVTSGDTPSSGTMDTWLNLGTSRSWSMVRSTPSVDPSTATLDVRIQRVSDHALCDSGEVILTAYVDF